MVCFKRRAKEKMEQPAWKTRPNFNVSLALFRYRNELHRNEARPLTKLQVTELLIRQNFRNMRQLNGQEANNLSRQIEFKEKLQNRLTIERKLLQCGLKDIYAAAAAIDDIFPAPTRMPPKPKDTMASKTNQLINKSKKLTAARKNETALQKLRQLFKQTKLSIIK